MVEDVLLLESWAELVETVGTGRIWEAITGTAAKVQALDQGGRRRGSASWTLFPEVMDPLSW